MEDRVYKVISETFGVPTKILADDSGPDNIKSWDSLGHINLVLALEAEFNVTVSPDEAAEMLSVGLIRKILRDKNVTTI